MNNIDLAGHGAVITGGARGIGYAIAERMIGSGAAVLLTVSTASALVRPLTTRIGLVVMVSAATGSVMCSTNASGGGVGVGWAGRSRGGIGVGLGRFRGGISGEISAVHQGDLALVSVSQELLPVARDVRRRTSIDDLDEGCPRPRLDGRSREKRATERPEAVTQCP